MPEEKSPDNSRQSVDLKWKLRKGLEEGLSADSDGNVEVGKNLDVDGSLTLNSASDLKTKDGSEGFVDLNTEQTITGQKTFVFEDDSDYAKQNIVFKKGNYTCNVGWLLGANYFGIHLDRVGIPISLSWGATELSLLNPHIPITVRFPSKNFTVAAAADVPTVRHHLVFAGDDFYATADLMTLPANSSALTLSTLASLLANPISASGVHQGGVNDTDVVLDCHAHNGSIAFKTANTTQTELSPTDDYVPSNLTLTDSVTDLAGGSSAAKEAPSWQDEEEE